LFKTTNKGHFLFISLGQLSENSWGIIPYDTDSLMRKIIVEQTGQGNTMTYEADAILTSKWLDLIVESPGEFANKCLSNFGKLNESPFYGGELWHHAPSVWEDSLMRTDLDRRIQSYSRSLYDESYQSWSDSKIMKFEFYQQRLITLFIYLALIGYFVRFGKEVLRDPFAVVFLTLVLYQGAISIFTYYTKEHNTNLFLVYILWIIYVFSEKKLFSKPLRRKDAAPL